MSKKKADLYVLCSLSLCKRSKLSSSSNVLPAQKLFVVSTAHLFYRVWCLNEADDGEKKKGFSVDVVDEEENWWECVDMVRFH